MAILKGRKKRLVKIRSKLADKRENLGEESISLLISRGEGLGSGM